MKRNPIVSIVCITYNHERFIRDALDGFVMQKTNFPFEILVNDDASTDGTADIVREYESKYPDLFRCVYHTKNQWGKKDVCRDILYPMIRGQYVALCEGDDYWTDPLKLQKQVDFLDAHPECSICFHPVTVKYDDKSQPDSIFPSEKMLQGKTILEFDDLLKCNFIQTNSVMYRWRFHENPLDLIPDGILPGDWFLHLLHAQVGKIGFLPDVMAVYRRHASGIWAGAWQTPEWFCRCGQSVLKFEEAVSKSFGADTLFERMFLQYATYYAAVFLKNTQLQNLFVNITQPVNSINYNKIKIIILKIMHHITWGKFSKKCKAEYKGLKLYNYWISKK